MKRPNDDDAEIRADNDPHSEVPVSDKKADQPAQDPLTIPSPETKRRIGGSALVQRWTELGLIGYRTDITDVEAHSRRLREAAQRRTAG
jgi:hypothetical protein